MVWPGIVYTDIITISKSNDKSCLGKNIMYYLIGPWQGTVALDDLDGRCGPELGPLAVASLGIQTPLG